MEYNLKAIKAYTAAMKATQRSKLKKEVIQVISNKLLLFRKKFILQHKHWLRQKSFFLKSVHNPKQNLSTVLKPHFMSWCKLVYILFLSVSQMGFNNLCKEVSLQQIVSKRQQLANNLVKILEKINKTGYNSVSHPAT